MSEAAGMSDTQARGEPRELLDEIERLAKMIMDHRNAPCPYWEEQGCALPMHYDAEDILKLAAELRGRLARSGFSADLDRISVPSESEVL